MSYTHRLLIDLNTLKIALVVCFINFGLTSTTFAAEIILKLKGASYTITGTLEGFDGRTYTLRSDTYGTTTFDSKLFECVSNNCPQDNGNQGIYTRSFQEDEKVIKSDFAIYGSNTIGAKLMPSLIDGYAEKIGAQTKRVMGSQAEEIAIELNNAQNIKLASIHLQSHGSDTSFPALATGAAQIGMSSRQIKDTELEKMKQQGLGDMRLPDREHVVALDGLLILTSPQNPVRSLSIEQIAGIFSGTLTDWSQVGGTAGPIHLYARDEKSGTFDTFNSLVLKPAKLKLASNAKRFESSPDLADEVTRDPGGIGFAGIAYKRNAKALAISSSCGIQNAPTTFNIKSEEYPLSRRLFLYTTHNLNVQHAKGLLEYISSDDAQKIIVKSGYIDQTPDLQAFSDQGDRMASAINVNAEDFNMALLQKFTNEFKNAKRLSTTFRFNSSSASLDNKSLADVKRLSKILQKNAWKGKEIFLLGFADSKGIFDINTQLSLTRANSVKTAIVSAAKGKIDPELIKTSGFGELMPVSCNDSPHGLEKNRRVEIWIRDQ